eukprot:g2317.t1
MNSRIAIVVGAVFVWSATTASATSAGDGGSCMDAVKLCTMGCPDDGKDRPWANSGCCPPGMDLVQPPEYSDKYAIEASSSGSYRPCEVTTITIRVKDPAYKYLGLLLYAVVDDGKEKKVGSWSVPPRSGIGAPRFWLPPACKGSAVMHANAGVKHFVSEFHFVGPPPGTGKIRFRALIKFGETNGGRFFWAGQEDLTLTEAAATAQQAGPTWIRSKEGQSCAEACAAAGPQGGSAAECDADAMKSSETSMEGPSRHFVCRDPAFVVNSQVSCATKSGILTDSDGFCYQRSAGDGCDGVDFCAKPPVGDMMRLCACSGIPTTTSSGSCPNFARSGASPINLNEEGGEGDSDGDEDEEEGDNDGDEKGKKDGNDEASSAEGTNLQRIAIIIIASTCVVGLVAFAAGYLFMRRKSQNNVAEPEAVMIEM